MPLNDHRVQYSTKVDMRISDHFKYQLTRRIRRHSIKSISHRGVLVIVYGCFLIAYPEFCNRASVSISRKDVTRIEYEVVGCVYIQASDFHLHCIRHGITRIEIPSKQLRHNGIRIYAVGRLRAGRERPQIRTRSKKSQCNRT